MVTKEKNLISLQIQQPEWKKILEKSITTTENLPQICSSELQQIAEVIKIYPMCINPYYLSLIKEKNDAIYKQCIPSIQELQDNLQPDPLAEENMSPVQGLVHRYPDRVLLIVSNKCAVYCRFCTRKRKVGTEKMVITKEQILQGIEYIKNHPEIRDVILSGGDPLMLEDYEIEWILKKLRDIKHVEIIRIGTRIPCSLPQRITPELCAMLKKYHPIYINTHFNHPDEITEEAKKACSLLADAGIPLGNQSVLLKGINDSPEIMKKLMQKLLQIRVKPYYLYQADMVKGTNHFRTKVSKGIEIIKSLRGFTSGMAVPHYVIDAPEGGGKIPILPDYLKEYKSKKLTLTNYRDKEYAYIDP
ncbi:MAG: KamA family radical SAM protein [Candidatus Pacearchaeota archaeon]